MTERRPPPGESASLALLGAAVAAGALAGWALLVAPFRLAITRHHVRLRAGADEGPSLRLVQLADLHLHTIGRRETHVARAVAALAPDLIVITGDMIERPRHLPLLERLLDMLPPGTPLYAVMGNWDHRAGVGVARMREIYGRHGGRLLVNESVTVRHAGREVLITGIDDLSEGTPDLEAAFAGLGPHAAHLVLTHCPALRDTVRAWVAARAGAARRSASGTPPAPTPRLLLAGHTHGGQVRPFGWAPVLPRASGRYVCGWYEDFLPAMYVSRGIGTSLVPIRLGSTPEIAELTLVI